MIEDSINQVLSHPFKLMQNIGEFIKQTHPYNDGKSSLRVLAAVEELLEGKNLPSKRKPLNLVRKFKARKKLGYWRLS